jgi:hypothetical protein
MAVKSPNGAQQAAGPLVRGYITVLIAAWIELEHDAAINDISHLRPASGSIRPEDRT